MLGEEDFCRAQSQRTGERVRTSRAASRVWEPSSKSGDSLGRVQPDLTLAEIKTKLQTEAGITLVFLVFGDCCEN